MAKTLEGIKSYPVTIEGKTKQVTIPGSGDLQPGPKSEETFQKFLAEAIEAYAEASEVARPEIRTFTEAGMQAWNTGLVVRIGDSEFQITLVCSK